MRYTDHMPHIVETDTRYIQVIDRLYAACHGNLHAFTA